MMETRRKNLGAKSFDNGKFHQVPGLEPCHKRELHVLFARSCRSVAVAGCQLAKGFRNHLSSHL